jgi:hypothetical protein
MRCARVQRTVRKCTVVTSTRTDIPPKLMGRPPPSTTRSEPRLRREPRLVRVAYTALVLKPEVLVAYASDYICFI